MAKKIKRLSQAEFYQLCKLLERDQEEAATLTAAELANRYSVEMGTPVTRATLLAACKATNIRCRRLPRQAAPGVYRVERVVRHICKELDLDYDTLAEGLRVEDEREASADGTPATTEETPSAPTAETPKRRRRGRR